MLTYFHPDQSLHHPRTYFSRGRMRMPQEVPERAARLVAAAFAMGFPVREPDDFGIAPIAAVHDTHYLRFLETVHREWKAMPEDWGDEAMSNIFVREPNALRGVLAQAARHLADGSCPVGEHTWRAAYWSAQSALAAAAAVRDGAPAAYALCRPPGHHA
ncbi:arginase family protein, partial [Burkholderia pseudomallei]